MVNHILWFIQRYPEIMIFFGISCLGFFFLREGKRHFHSSYLVYQYIRADTFLFFWAKFWIFENVAGRPATLRDTSKKSTVFAFCWTADFYRSSYSALRRQVVNWRVAGRPATGWVKNPIAFFGFYTYVRTSTSKNPGHRCRNVFLPSRGPPRDMFF